MIWLQQGDCLELMKNIPDGSVDMILCDLPYGTTRNKWDSVIDFDELWTAYKRIIKNNGAIVLFCDGMFTAKLLTSNPRMWRYNLVWDKQRGCDFLNANVKPLKCHEDIAVFYKHKPTYNKQYWYSEPYKRTKNGTLSANYGNRNEAWSESVNGERNPLTILSFAKDSDRKHPTQKPIALLEWLIKTYTNEGDTVLDNCMGSGSTGVACVNLKRNFIGMEIEEEYFKIAEERINNARLNQQSRQAAQTELMTKCERYTLARESHGMGRVEWSSDLISVGDAMDAIRNLPSAQPATNCTEIPNSSDVVSRKAVREMVATWSYDMAEWEDVELALSDVDKLPSAHPEIIHCKDCALWHRTGCPMDVFAEKPEPGYFCGTGRRKENE